MVATVGVDTPGDQSSSAPLDDACTEYLWQIIDFVKSIDKTGHLHVTP